MTTSFEYDPPSTAAMRARQDESDAVRLLISQRRLYRRAKRWLGARWLGLVIIGIGAPVVSVIEPDLAVVASALAGIWLFLGRTWLLARQTAITSQAAAVQEKSDLHVFGMPEIARRSELPSLERIADLSGPEAQLRKVAEKERLLAWYPIEGHDGTVAVAIAQRANASYSDSLLKTTATTWSVLFTVWVAALSIMSLFVGLSLAEFLLGVVFPVLPAFLDVVQYVGGVRRSAREKNDLARAIEDRLSGRSGDVQPEDLLVWQAQLFDLRRTAPEVPDLIYKLRRKRNEHAMNVAARQLSAKAKGPKT